MLLNCDHLAKTRFYSSTKLETVAVLGFFCLSCFQRLIYHGPDSYLAALNVKL